VAPAADGAITVGAAAGDDETAMPGAVPSTTGITLRTAREKASAD
jgi:hypothetical protein